MSVLARRFYCDAVLCGRRIFGERFDAAVLAPWSRRTARLDHIVHHLGLALGGRPAASFARRLMVPASNGTLLRVVRRRGSPNFVPPAVIGIDDWAYEARIAALERMVGRQALEIEFLKGALKHGARPRSAATSVVTGLVASPSPKGAG